MTEARVDPAGWVTLGRHRFRAALGRGGVSGHKQEGDGATPAGLLPLRRVLYRADRVAIPGTDLPREPIGPRDGWCDDPGRAEYNRPVARPFDGSSEALWRDDPIYDIVGVLGWNDAPVVHGAGSAIFLHLARPDYGPTEGCVALALPHLLALLAEGTTALRVG